MKHLGLLLVAVLAVSAVILPLAYFSSVNQGANPKDEFFFGVTYGEDTVEGAKLLIDRVQGYTNIFILDSFVISNNESLLDGVCSYAASKNLPFFVYFYSFVGIPWEQDWVTNANQRWGDKFLGVYLRDEPGGRQIDKTETIQNASSYIDAANKFVQNVSSKFSMHFLISHDIPVVTSDFALYWFDYQAGFDVIFAQLGWNNTRTQEIALCRGAANIKGKDWGAMVSWTYQGAPYIGSGPETYQDMVAAYEAGAKYVLVFDYPQYPQSNPYGILGDEHFLAMQQFWDFAKTHPRDLAAAQGEVAFVMPQGYGWGMRNPNDWIWGLWPAVSDNSSALIWQNLHTLIDRYGSKLDIVYEGNNGVNLADYYSKLYFWNETIA